MLNIHATFHTITMYTYKLFYTNKMNFIGTRRLGNDWPEPLILLRLIASNPPNIKIIKMRTLLCVTVFVEINNDIIT